MDQHALLAVMEAMAQKIEALTERLESAERRLDEARKCSCQTWREHTQLPREKRD